MKRINLKKSILLFFVLLIMPQPSFANSGPTSWDGQPTSEVLIIDEASPIIIESEHLTFDLRSMDRTNYSIQSDVMASYEMKNPTDTDLTVQMAFPFISTINDFKQQGISITVEVETIEYELFLGNALNYLNDKAEEVSFSNIIQTINTKPYKAQHFTEKDNGILYTIDVASKNKMRFDAIMDIKYQHENTRLVTDGFNNSNETDTGIQLVSSCKDKNRMELFCIGEDVKWNFVLYDENDTVIKEADYSLQVDRQVMDVESFLYRCIREERESVQKSPDIGYDETLSELSDKQLYHVYASKLDEDLSDTYQSKREPVLRDYLINYHENRVFVLSYSVVFPANSTRTVRVQYKAAAAMDSTTTNTPLYSFTYLLNPAKYWADFKDLKIDIYTPELAPYILKTNIPLQNTENRHYWAEIPALPDTDLSFTIFKNPRITESDKKTFQFNLLQWIRDILESLFGGPRPH